MLMGAMLLTSLSGCGGNSGSGSGNTDTSAQANAGTETAKSGEAIRIVNGKIEIDEPLKAFAKSYQEKTGQEVIIESLGGGVDINGTLK